MSSKLTDEQVIEMRKLLSNGTSQREVANQFGISKSQIHRIANNVSHGPKRIRTNWNPSLLKRDSITPAQTLRFWNMVSKTNDDDDLCWEWQGARQTPGPQDNLLPYGKFFYVTHPLPKVIQAHRFSYIVNKGDIPPDMMVCHTCDNPPCVRPSHLWLGSRADNNHDKDSKGRGADNQGEGNGRHILTEADVREMRVLASYAPDTMKTREALAERYNVHPMTIKFALTGRNWGWLN